VKSNDQIPEDEMLLAEAIAAARGNDLGWTRAKPFARNSGRRASPDTAERVCALGALHFANVISIKHPLLDELTGAWHGNDYDGNWMQVPQDNGESLGFAFRCFMTQEESDV
jgi:hypothetical protein